MEKFSGSQDANKTQFERTKAIKLGSKSLDDFKRGVIDGFHQLSNTTLNEDKTVYQFPNSKLIKRLDIFKHDDRVEAAIIHNASSDLKMSSYGWVDMTNPKRYVSHGSVLNILQDASYGVPMELLYPPAVDDSYIDELAKSLEVTQPARNASRVITHATNNYLVNNDDFFNETTSRMQMSIKAGKLAAILVETSTPFEVQSGTVTKTIRRIATHDDAGQAVIRYRGNVPVSQFSANDKSTPDLISEITAKVVDNIVDDKLSA